MAGPRMEKASAAEEAEAAVPGASKGVGRGVGKEGSSAAVADDEARSASVIGIR